MKPQNQTDALNKAISLLQHKQTQELIALKEQLQLSYETLKPINLIKKTLHEVALSPDIKNNLVNNIIGLTTGYLSKKVLVGASHNPIKRVFGTVMQFAIANVVSKHSDTVKAVVEMLVHRILLHLHKPEPAQHLPDIEANSSIND